MTLHQRIQRADLQRAQANRERRQEYMDRLYSKGWTPAPEPTRWDVAQTAVGVLAMLAIIAWWTLG